MVFPKIQVSDPRPFWSSSNTGQISWSDFEIITQEFSLGEHFQKLFVKLCSINKHDPGKWGLLAQTVTTDIKKF